MDDLGLNKYLEETYGTTVDGKVLFRLTWTTGVTEKRYAEFHDHYGDVFLRAVREVREVLKYPFAQNRWALEKIRLVTDQIKDEFGLVVDNPYSYEEIYIFQDKSGNFLPLNREMLDAAMFLYFTFYLRMTPKEKIDFRIANLAARDKEKRDRVRNLLGEGRAAHGFVIERAAGIDRSKK